MDERMNWYVKELVRLGHVCTVAGSDKDKDMRQLVAMGFAKKAWFKNRYMPTDLGRTLAALIQVGDLIAASYKPSNSL
jgi:hypothetical protein